VATARTWLISSGFAGIQLTHGCCEPTPQKVLSYTAEGARCAVRAASSMRPVGYSPSAEHMSWLFGRLRCAHQNQCTEPRNVVPTTLCFASVGGHTQKSRPCLERRKQS
jgi:hypothetical protein